MRGNGYVCKGNVPGSIYSFLLDNALVPDPFYRDNELLFFELAEHEYSFERQFDYSPDGYKVNLVFEGLDTLCEVFVNDFFVAKTYDMHVKYEFDVGRFLRDGKNTVKVVCKPVNPYIKEKFKKEYVPSIKEPMAGFSYIRKAHCMLGWDWGGKFPDGGIWRPVYLSVKDSCSIYDVEIFQRHIDGKVFITPKVICDGGEINVRVLSPSNKEFTLIPNRENEIVDPELWWPNNFGKQNLYLFDVELSENGKIVDKVSKKIGLRVLRLVREKDEWGESFCHEINGVRIFAMGADYIPEDNILSRITAERSRKLLTHCKNSNFNAIRVWGGGFYPSDEFFDVCDELGLIVFLDLMFACSLYNIDKQMSADIDEEIKYNVKRLRHHACLGVISGNNECEWQYSGADEKFKKAYLDLFEKRIPNILKKIAPYIPYIPSSPTSHGGFNDPNSENVGDAHFWEVWHGRKPFTEYRKTYFRYLSEFGFQSFPCLKTVESFTLPKDRNVFSRIMEMHQRNHSANGAIIGYLSETFLYPNDFDTMLFASQLLQAEAIRYGVEHYRRHRGRCMGTLFWQLNDIWPVASWSSIDYFGRFKALQYAAKRFFNPIMISCEESGETTSRYDVNMEQGYYDYSTTARLNVTNETTEPVKGIVKWRLMDNRSDVLYSGETSVCVKELSSLWLDLIDFCKTDVNNNYLYYEFVVDGVTVSYGTTIFTAPKYFNFIDPKLSYSISGNEITVVSQAYAKYVEITSPDCDLILSDNYFDMNKETRTIKIIEGNPKALRLRSVFDIK